ncbi:MAG: MBOAT family protein [Bacteroidales bacterium]|nr:MBOAT family protein [Bacteroidales bacterium]
MFQGFHNIILILLFVGIFTACRRLLKRDWLDNVLLLAGNILILAQIVSYKSLLLLFLLSLIVFGAGWLLQKNQRKWLLATALILLLALFAIRQYPLVQSWLGSWWTDVMDKHFLSVEKIGLSYILFRMVHWLVECRRQTLRSHNLLTYINYLFFFPTFTAGPIDTFNNFHYWLSHTRVRLHARMLMAGVGRIFMGTVKTLLVVPLLLPYATNYQTLLPYMGPWGAVLSSAILYSFYIYIDFSGYCDTAIGLAYMMGVRTPENFNNPYLSSNIAEFWRRWHITFSSFLKTYVFKPLIALLNRFPIREYRTVVSVIAYLLTFLVCGLWHGSTLNFVLWGLWHGVGLSMYKIFDTQWPPKPTRTNRLAGTVLTFVFVTVGWILFNYPMDKLLVMIKLLIG